MPTIRLLSDQLINRIAAGEVVERPASVLKELLENCLDAGADNILVEAEAGGRKRICTADNGRGMSPDDLLLSVERHATSKLVEETDLLHIETLGFRGEALASIGAVSRLTILTAAGEDGKASRLRLSGGRTLGLEDAARERGATIDVRDLFFNVPARRKFLKTVQTESSHLLETVQRYVLGRPDLRLVYRHDGQELLSVSPREDGRTRLSAVVGREAARACFQFEDRSGDLAVNGFLSRPEVTRSRPSALFLFVNRRPVRDRLLTRAVLDAYRERLPSGRYPVAVVNLDIDPAQVDVNVHPAKAEVRFRRPGDVHGAVAGMIGRALSRNIRTLSGPARTASGYVVGHRPPVSVREPSLALNWSEPPSRPDISAHPVREWPPSRSNGPEPPFVPRPVHSESPPGEPWARSENPAAGPDPGELKPVGQLFRSYILAQGDDGLYVIDQHAAHERILFERLQDKLSEGPLDSQGLLVPETIDLAPGQAADAATVLGAFSRFGFDLEPFGGQTFVLRAVPGILAGKDVLRTVSDVLEAATEEDPGRGLSDLEDALMSSLACHAAVKAGDEMTFPEMNRLLADLAACRLPTHCPHGRPLIFSLQRREIEKRFGRA